jgi:hypothetical protein
MQSARYKGMDECIRSACCDNPNALVFVKARSVKKFLLRYFYALFLAVVRKVT